MSTYTLKEGGLTCWQPWNTDSTASRRRPVLLLKYDAMSPLSAGGTGTSIVVKAPLKCWLISPGVGEGVVVGRPGL